jgi:hypothetical protein
MVVVHVPDGVAAAIDSVAAEIGALEVDATRFPPHATGHRSPGYETATNRVEIHAKAEDGVLRVLGPGADDDALEPLD